jgi:hypothetical protein
MQNTETISLRELEHDYFMDLIYAYLKRNDVLTFDFHYDKRQPEESGEILIYDRNSECVNSKIKFIPID